MKKKALLVGIDDYAPLGPGGPDLAGCKNDVRDVFQTLVGLGVIVPTAAATRILADGAATRARIVDGIEWLLRGNERGDSLVFYYSGHGSQLAATDAGEVDRRDETICPHDYATAGMIRDNDLRDMIARYVPADGSVNLEVILDSCHSGTGTRDLGSAAGEAEAVRYVDPPLADELLLAANPRVSTRRFLTSAAAMPVEAQRGGGIQESLVPAKLNHVLWAACRDFQLAKEKVIGGVRRGVFTYNFCRTLRSIGLKPRRMVDSMVTMAVRSMASDQEPQTEGTPASFAEPIFR